MRIAKRVLLPVIAAVWLLTACVGQDQKRYRETVEGSFEVLWDVATGLSAPLHFIQHLQAAFPDAAFDYMNLWRTGYRVDLDDLRKADRSGSLYPYLLAIYDDKPADLVVFEHILAPHYIDSGYLAPLDEFVESDLSIRERLDPDLLAHLREQGDGSVYAIPFAKNAYGLFYNKELFDRFQIPYPTDGMTWDEVFDLARRIGDAIPSGEKTILDMDGIFQEYIYLNTFGLADRHLAFSQMGGRFPDPEAGVPDFRDPVWIRYDQFVAELESLNAPRPFFTYKTFAEGYVAMVAGRLHGSPFYSGAGHETTDLLMAPVAEWDMVSFPVFADAPDTGPAPAYYYVGIPENSPRKREAFRMISHLLSDEVQLENSRNGIVSVRSEPEFREVFAERTYKPLGKHVESLVYHPKEATLGPDYDIFMQYGYYQWGAPPVDSAYRDRFFGELRNEYMEMAEFRRQWRDHFANPGE